MDTKPLKDSMNTVSSDGVARAIEQIDGKSTHYLLDPNNAPTVLEVIRRLTQEGKIPVLGGEDFGMEIYNCCGLLMDYSGVDPQPYGIIWNCHTAGEDSNGETVTADDFALYRNFTLLLDENGDEQEYDPEQDEWDYRTITNAKIYAQETQPQNFNDNDLWFELEGK